ncbi:MAG: uroporphyrinogen-III synthase, partial [Pseudomonadota bacterium]
MAPLPVLLTRPEAQARAMVPRLQAMGAGGIVISSLLQIRFAERLPGLADGLIFTSRNGVAAYEHLGGPTGRAAWCVGERTAHAARALGLRVRGVTEDAATLATVIPLSGPDLIHLRGRVQRGDLAQTLRDRGIRAKDAVIYDQAPVPLSAEAVDMLCAGPVCAPLYSPRTAQLFAQSCPLGARDHLRLVALSPAVAAACAVPPVATAAAPTSDAMWR